MQESGSISFDPVRPAPMETWQVVVAVVIFACLIAVVVWRFSKRNRSNPGSLHLDDK